MPTTRCIFTQRSKDPTPKRSFLKAVFAFSWIVRATLVREGSRADVRAKGVWRDGIWTVEFSRKLATNNLDDIQFNVGQVYQLGVSRYEIAGRKRNPSLDQPWYGAGEVTAPLILQFQSRAVANR
jgi:hypothetical protein